MFLFPAGYRRSSEFGEGVQSAAAQGRLSCLKFLNSNYVTPEHVEVWQRSRYISLEERELMDRGFVPLGDVFASGLARQAFIASPFATSMQKVSIRFYAPREDIEKFKEAYYSEKGGGKSNRRKS